MMLIVKINGKYEQRILIIHFSSFIKHTNIILLCILYKHADSVKKEILLLVTVGQTMPILTLRKASLAFLHNDEKPTL